MSSTEIQTTTETFEIKQVDPKIKIISKKEEFLDSPFIINIFVMTDCLWIWIGNETSPSFSNLSTAMNSKFVGKKKTTITKSF